MSKDSATSKPAKRKPHGFAHLLSQDPELAALRAECAQRTPSERRAAAEWAYDESLATQLFGAALARVHAGGLPEPEWPPGYAALAIEPEYAPALLTVGCHEYASGRRSEGLRLLLRVTQLPPTTPDWVEIIDKAGQFLMDAGDPANTCRLYRKALVAQPQQQQQFVVGMGWALCRAGRQAEALPWLERAVANAPQESSVLSDYGWALTELGRFEEAQPLLEEAVRLAPPDYDLPANNLKRLLRLRQEGGSGPRPQSRP